MKKLITTLAACLLLFSVEAQVMIQKAFTPQNGVQYFEIFNNSNNSVDLGCYSLITHFKNLNEAGFYIVKFPQTELKGKELMLIGSGENLNPVNPTGRPQFSWNMLAATGYLQKFLMSDNEMQLIDGEIPKNNPEVRNSFRSKIDFTEHVVFLMNGSTLVDASVNLDAENNLPEFLDRLPQLSYNNNCGSTVTVAFNSIKNRFPDIFNHPNQQHQQGYFKEFQVQRNSSSVQVAWQTARTIDNNGFYIERRSSSEPWTTVAFVASVDAEGTNNNNDVLQYNYGDRSILNDRTEYRLRTLDANGKAFYSPIKVMNAYGQEESLVIYPNPSQDGRANISFGRVNSLRDVQVIDINGRIVQQWVSVNSTSQQLQNLRTGHYVVRVIDRQTGTVSSKMLVVNN